MAVKQVVLGVVDPSDVWGTDLRMRLPSADSGAIDREVANTVQEFLQRSGALALTLDMDVTPGQDVYSYNTVPTQQIPIDLSFGGATGLYCHQIRLEDGSILRLSDHRPRNLITSSSSPTVAWNSGLAGQFQVYPTPSSAMAGQKFICLLTLIMKSPISSVPEHVATWYYDVILDGATGRMMSHPKRPYSDPKLAVYYLKRFRNGIRVAIDEAKRGWMNADSSFLYNQDWSRKTQLRHP